MRPLPRRLTPLAVVLSLAACGKPTSQGLFTAAPTLDAVPEFRPLSMRQAPESTRDELVLSLEQGNLTPDDQNVVNSPGARASEPGARPSVIISVSAEATAAARMAAQLRQQGRVPNPAATDSALNASESWTGPSSRPSSARCGTGPPYRATAAKGTSATWRAPRASTWP